MRAFKVHLNSQRLCVAGVGEQGVLSAIVDYVGSDDHSRLHLRVGGLFTQTDEHAVWRSRSLKVGDRIVLTVIETDTVDRPRKRYRPDSKTAEKNQKAYVRAWANKFGWEIVIPPNAAK
jgi:hypothetical protein